MAAACCLGIGGTCCVERMSWLKQAAKVDGSAILRKENSCALINALKSMCFDEKTLKKGEVAAFHSNCLKLAHSQYSHLVQAYGLWKLNWLFGKAVDIGSVFSEVWNEIGLVSFPAPIGPSTTPFGSCHPERISHKWLRDHKVFYTDVIL